MSHLSTLETVVIVVVTVIAFAAWWVIRGLV